MRNGSICLQTMREDVMITRDMTCRIWDKASLPKDDNSGRDHGTGFVIEKKGNEPLWMRLRQF